MTLLNNDKPGNEDLF